MLIYSHGNYISYKFHTFWAYPIQWVPEEKCEEFQENHLAIRKWLKDMAFSNMVKVGFKPTTGLAGHILFVCGTCNSALTHAHTLTGEIKYHACQKGTKGKASIPTDDLIPKTGRGRNQHSMTCQTSIVSTDAYKGSFFPQTIKDWTALPDSLIFSAEVAEDCVAKFTSLVRARD